MTTKTKIIIEDGKTNWPFCNFNRASLNDGWMDRWPQCFKDTRWTHVKIWKNFRHTNIKRLIDRSRLLRAIGFQPTDRQANGPTDGPTDWPTKLRIESPACDIKWVVSLTYHFLSGSRWLSFQRTFAWSNITDQIFFSIRQTPFYPAIGSKVDINHISLLKIS